MGSNIVRNSALAASAQGQAWQQTAGLLLAVQSRNLRLDLVGFNTILSGGAHAEEWAQSVLLFQNFAAGKTKLDGISYSSAAGVIAAAGRWDLSLHCLVALLSTGRALNVVSVTEAVRACGKMGMWRPAILAHSILAGRSIEPNMILNNVILNALEMTNRWAEALSWSATARSLTVQTNEVGRLNIGRQHGCVQQAGSYDPRR